MASILFIGPGAIGATLIAWLCQDDRHQVTAAARTPFDSIETQTPGGLIRAKPRVITDVRQAPPSDWILVATKAYDSDAAARWFAGATHPHTRLAVIQNGVEHIQRFEQHFPRERIVPVMIDLPAERETPGRTLQRGP
ncbi:MAG TPA: 2-dehydropantoate 2-reductase N-terminal domain-containing protein, partial [Ramlibacter sp.]|uniref:2-dehydropantoate 2-reductase N-terminal domain-containing protein n=1 Tax=Ramlibacter sp. TaxID=1917967 RepID=UPI002D8085DD